MPIFGANFVWFFMHLSWSSKVYQRWDFAGHCCCLGFLPSFKVAAVRLWGWHLNRAPLCMHFQKLVICSCWHEMAYSSERQNRFLICALDVLHTYTHGISVYSLLWRTFEEVESDINSRVKFLKTGASLVAWSRASVMSNTLIAWLFPSTPCSPPSSSALIKSWKEWHIKINQSHVSLFCVLQYVWYWKEMCPMTWLLLSAFTFSWSCLSCLLN